MSAHLGYDKHALDGRGTGNSRNGTTSKIVKGEFGEVTINTPRDRNGDFEPKVIKKNQTRFDGFDAKILAMYSFGMSTRDIQENLKDIYGVDISPDLVSQVTDVVIEDVKEWQSRTLERIYPIVYLDALRTNIRDQGQVKNKSVYTALGINLMGKKEVLGLWIDQTEGAKFWLNVLTQLKNRGVEKIYVACVDGLKGFPEAIKGVFPETEVQLCLVHMVRHSLVYVGSKDKKNVSLDLKKSIRQQQKRLD
jgi:putative transposase